MINTGRSFHIMISMVLVGLVACGPQEAFEKFEIARGVNISHWLSQSKARGQERLEYFQKEDVDYIASLGFDHIRIPIDEEQMWSEDNQKETEAFQLLHNAIGWAQGNNLKVIVDLHILRSHHFNRGEKPLWTDPAAQELFFQNWRDLSEELSQYPNDLVAYELMNEPVVDDPDKWNTLVAKATEVVRETEPYRYIVIGSNMWQSVFTFDDLQLPQDDPYIILSFHFYHPFLITHHKASWTNIAKYDGPVQYPGWNVSEEDLVAIEDTVLRQTIQDMNGYFDKDSLEAMMEQPFRKARETGLQLYCGEWGVYPTIPRESFAQWYTDVRSILESNNVAWANWDYQGGFGIVKDGEPVEDLTNILVGDLKPN